MANKTDREQSKEITNLFSTKDKLKEHAEETLIEDGRTINIKCSSCKIELVDVWVIRPGAPITTEITALCPHCGDKSFTHTINGQYCLGHVESGITKMTETKTDTVFVNDDSCFQKILVKTSK